MGRRKGEYWATERTLPLCSGGEDWDPMHQLTIYLSRAFFLKQ